MIIYKATNLVNNKCYIGKTTTSLKQRKIEHFCDIKRTTVYFHNALRKYGEENFKWEIIYECDDILILNVMETFKIMICHSHKSEDKGYNLTWGGEDSPMSNPEISKKVSFALKGRKLTEEHKRNLSNSHKGKKLTEEHKKKLSISKLGHITTEETKKKIGKFHSGKKLSEETKKKLSEKAKGRKHSKETKLKMSISRRLVNEKKI